MIGRAVVLGALVAGGACGGGRPPAAPPRNDAPAAASLDTEHGALARFDALVAGWAADPAVPRRDVVADLDAARRDGRGAVASARAIGCDEAHAQAAGTLGADRGPVIAGSLDALAAVGAARCWTVSLAYGFTTLIVVLGADGGDLLLAWLPPEG